MHPTDYLSELAPTITTFNAAEIVVPPSHVVKTLGRAILLDPEPITLKMALGRGSATVSAMILWAMGAGSVSKTTSLILNFSSTLVSDWAAHFTAAQRAGVTLWYTADVYGASLCTKKIEADEGKIEESEVSAEGKERGESGRQLELEVIFIPAFNAPHSCHGEHTSNATYLLVFAIPTGFIQPQIQSEHGLRTTNEFAAYELHVLGGLILPSTRLETLGYVVWSELNTVETDGGRSAQTPDMEDEIRGAQVHAHSVLLCFQLDVTVAHSGPDLSDHRRGATAYFVSVLDKVRPRTYNPEAADALCAMRGEHLQRGGKTAEDVCRTIAGSILGRQGPDDEAQ
ncbi:hypothetical protein DFH09DRAFT_1091624 [Mycena vulgaris]|nr:hypothetical protein DFH09DRAFT_1091624 [Mycena vulgaris]